MRRVCIPPVQCAVLALVCTDSMVARLAALTAACPPGQESQKPTLV